MPNYISKIKLPSSSVYNIRDSRIDVDANGKISTRNLPDVILGQLVYGGTVELTGEGTGIRATATLSTNAKAKLGTTSSTITLANNNTSPGGYSANEGIYYILSNSGTIWGIDFETGDWVISTGSAWKKIDNTDAVKSVNGQTGNVVIDIPDGIEVVTFTLSELATLDSADKTPAQAEAILQSGKILMGKLVMAGEDQYSIYCNCSYFAGEIVFGTDIYESPESTQFFRFEFCGNASDNEWINRTAFKTTENTQNMIGAFPDTIEELSTEEYPSAILVKNSLDSKANSADLSAVATSGSYNDLTDKPTIPTVNNATLTIQKNGTTVNTFTANASSNVTANITVPTKTSDLTNDSDFITNSTAQISESQVTNLTADLAAKANQSTTYTKTEVDALVNSTFRYKGTVATYSALPTTGRKTGDVWNIEQADPSHGVKAGDNVAFDGRDWDVLAGTVDLSAYYTKTEVDSELSGKVDKITGKGLSANDYTTAEKNKLAGIAAGAEVNVQSDWNQTNSSADDYIKNKPTIPAHLDDLSDVIVPGTGPGGDKILRYDNNTGFWKPDDEKTEVYHFTLVKSGNTYTLPSGVTYNDIKSKYSDGILCVARVPQSNRQISHEGYDFDVDFILQAADSSIASSNDPLIFCAPLLNAELTTDYFELRSDGSIVMYSRNVFLDTSNVETAASTSGLSAVKLVSGKLYAPASPEAVIGSLNTTAATSQTTSSGESFGGNITLHKISKTGNYNDLLNKPTIPTNTSDLTNNSGFITNSNAQISESQVTDLSSDLTAIRNSISSKKNIFKVTPSTTTYQQITDAKNRGDYIICEFNGMILEYCDDGTSNHKFVGISKSLGSTEYDIYEVTCFSTNTWFTTAQIPGTVTSITAGTGLSGGTITASGTISIDATLKSNWDSAYTHSTSEHAPSNAEANQNAFSNVKVGTTTIAADTTTDTIELVAGSNITLTPDATNDKVTISASGGSSVGTLDTTNSTNLSPAQESMSGNISLHKVSKTGEYSDLRNKPTIPTVNDSTVTVYQGGVQKGSFSLNQSSTAYINLDEGVFKVYAYGTSTITVDKSIADIQRALRAGKIVIMYWQENAYDGDNTYIDDTNILIANAEAAYIDDVNAKVEFFGSGVKIRGVVTTADDSWEFVSYGYIQEPDTDGTSGQVLATDGDGSRYWTTVSGGGGGTGTVESVRVQATDGLTSSQSSAQSVSLNTTIGVDSSHKLPTTTEWNSKADTSELPLEVIFSQSGNAIISDKTAYEIYTAYDSGRLVFGRTSYDNTLFTISSCDHGGGDADITFSRAWSPANIGTICITELRFSGSDTNNQWTLTESTADGGYTVVRMTKITNDNWIPNSYQINDSPVYCEILVNVEPSDNKKYYYIVDIDENLAAAGGVGIAVGFNMTGQMVNNKQTNYILFINRTDKEINIEVYSPQVQSHFIHCIAPASMPVIDATSGENTAAKEISIIGDLSEDNPSLGFISWTASEQLSFRPGI